MHACMYAWVDLSEMEYGMDMFFHLLYFPELVLLADSEQCLKKHLETQVGVPGATISQLQAHPDYIRSQKNACTIWQTNIK